METFEDGQDEDFSEELSEEIISEDTTDEEGLEEYEDDKEEDNQDAEGYMHQKWKLLVTLMKWMLEIMDVGDNGCWR